MTDTGVAPIHSWTLGILELLVEERAVCSAVCVFAALISPCECRCRGVFHALSSVGLPEARPTSAYQWLEPRSGDWHRTEALDLAEIEGIIRHWPRAELPPIEDDLRSAWLSRAYRFLEHRLRVEWAELTGEVVS